MDINKNYSEYYQMEYTREETNSAIKKENPLSSITFNIIIPVIVLSSLSSDNYLGPVAGLITALLFPLCYGLYDFAFKKRNNLFSILGFISIFLTGIIGLLKFPPAMFAVKEAALPFIIGVANLVSIGTRFPLVKTFIYNKEILDVEKIDSVLEEKEMTLEFEKTLMKASVLLSCSFFISSFLHYVLTKLIVTSLPGTANFNADLGMMALIQFPVIAIPCTLIMGIILWYLFVSIKKLTGLQSHQIFSEKIRVSLEETKQK